MTTRSAAAPDAASPYTVAPKRLRLLLVLAGLSGVSPLATDMYVAALPDLARSLATDASGAQLSLTGFLVGIIAGQLALGPLSDAVGRRPVLIGGSVVFAGFSLVCALAPTVAVLNSARVGQGVAGAAGIVVSRAVVTDLFDDRELPTVFSRLGAIGAMAPVLAPLAGGALLLLVPWRYVFAVLALMGVALAAGVWRWIPESHPPDARLTGGLAPSLRAIGRTAAQPAVLAPVLALACGGAAVFAYIAGTTFVFQDIYHLSPALSSLVYGVNALGNMFGSLAYGHLSRHRSPEALLIISGVLATTGAVALLLVQTTTGSNMPLTWLCLLITISAFGLFFPAVITIAQSRGRAAPGATSALLGGGQFLLGAAASPVVGLFGTQSPAPMAAVMAVSLTLGTLAAIATKRTYGDQRQSPERGLGEE
ncbi:MULTISPECIES: multidrug effflux MFS transporter [unclassified Streptomyces]|uniref:multidrug effflux MFS transporter n=1 Tax=unclassified Streptomyces TaxID=2593676 RepID=UPI0013CD0A0F|nr:MULTISPECIES: multidrug effflux MFS transporter [unclassified Streptomyces]NDZ73567.1 multidrug effflux MFS transporter [Streptomyces sp. SID10362]QUW88847.1 Bicyclomycin resistance protein [Streptomyces sp. V17-9]WKX23272.1 multidrug effflux MFS transporter [Streptomyces sp. HUAS CX7]